MRLPTLIYVFVFLISKKTEATIIQSVKTGNWTSSSTWDSGTIPTISDTVTINNSDTIFINTSSANCSFLQIEGVAFFRSASNQLNSENSLLQGGEIAGTALGLFESEILQIEDISKIGKCNLNISDSLIIKGNLDLSSSSGSKEINHLLVTGSLTNSSDEDLKISGNITNVGNIDFGDGKTTFTTPSTITGHWIFSKVEIADSLINLDSLTINSSIEGSGFLKNKGTLSLGMTNTNFMIDSLNLETEGNKLIMSRNGNQTIPKLSNNTFTEISFSGDGSFLINEDLTGQTITINSEAELTVENKIIADSIKIADSGSLLIYSNFDLNEINTLLCKPKSLVNLNKDQTLNRSFQFGDFEIEAGFIATSNYPDTISISGDFKQSGSFDGNAVVRYNGKQQQTIKERNYHHLIYDNTSTDSSVFYGDYSIDTISVLNGKIKIGSLTVNKTKIDTNGTIQIGGHSPIFNDTVFIKGNLIILSDLAAPSFSFLKIKENGAFENESTSHITIQNGINNEGTFNGCSGNSCLYTFEEDKAYLTGTDTIKIPKINAQNIYNHGILSLSKGLEVDSFFNQANAILISQVDTQNIKGHLEFSASNNTLILNKAGDQALSETITDLGNFEISGSGIKSLSHDIHIKGDFKIHPESILKTESFQIIGNPMSSMEIDSAAQLTLGHNFHERNITFPDQFNVFNLHDSSIVKFAAMGDQEISTKPTYGNLLLDDGAVISCYKTITGDTLKIKSHLGLQESSLTLLANENNIDLEGDWNGPGAVKLTSGHFHIAGDGNSDGNFEPGTSKVIYDGNTRQRIKVGIYYDLIVDKTNNAYTRANTNNILVNNNTIIKNGVLEFSTEKCEIQNLIIEDSVIFSSKLQDKLFEDISITSTGVFLLDIDEEIFISGNIQNEGEFISINGQISFIDSVNSQQILGSGSFLIDRSELKKKTSTLTIEAPINLTDTLDLVSGLIELNTPLSLSDNGFIKGESQENLIYGNGKISTSLPILPGSYDNIGGIGLSLTTVSPMGKTLFERELSPGLISDGESIKRVYNIEPQFNSGLNTSISFNYWESELNGNIEDELEVYKSTDNGITWFNHSGTIDKTTNQVTISGISSFSKWTIGSGNITPLAVELLSFSGMRESNNIKLNWEVLVEIGTSYYQINFSEDGINFDSLTTVFPDSDLNYQAIWDQAPNKTLYFELIEIETSGKVNRLDTIFVLPDHNQAPQAWIENNKIKIENFSVGTINLYDSRGRLIQQNKNDVSNLPSGKYFIELLSPSKRWTFDAWKN